VTLMDKACFSFRCKWH